MTSSIAAWLAGSRTNNGWIVLPTGGNNGVDLQFSTNVNSPYLDVPTVGSSPIGELYGAAASEPL